MNLAHVTLLGDYDGSGLNIGRNMIIARDGSTLQATGVVVENGLKGLYAYNGSTVHATDLHILNSSLYGIMVHQSDVSLTDFLVEGSNSHAVYHFTNSSADSVTLRNGCITNVGGSGLFFRYDSDDRFIADGLLIAHCGEQAVCSDGSPVFTLEQATLDDAWTGIRATASASFALNNCIVSSMDTLFSLDQGSAELTGVLAWEYETASYGTPPTGSFRVGNPLYVNPANNLYAPHNGSVVRSAAVGAVYVGAYPPSWTTLPGWARSGWSRPPFRGAP